MKLSEKIAASSNLNAEDVENVIQSAQWYGFVLVPVETTSCDDTYDFDPDILEQEVQD